MEEQKAMTPKFSLKTIRIIVMVFILMCLSGYVGYRVGHERVSVTVSPQERKIVVNVSPPPSREVDFSQFWDVWARLEQKYLDKEKLDPQKMVYGAITGMVSSIGDPYTVFLPPKQNKEFQEDLNGQFEGIGAQLGAKDDKIVVIAPLRGHPAEKAGVLPGDWIIKVNEEDTFGWTVPQAVAKIRGPKGTQVKLTIIHEGSNEPVEVSITRERIIIKSVEFEVKTSSDPSCKQTHCPQIGYIKLSRFGDQTNDEWNAAISELRRQDTGNLKGVVLDLRSNPGGYFQSAIHVSSEFIKNGIVVRQQNSDGSEETYSVTRVGKLLNVPLVVLINKGSASAAEIVAGALHDHQRAQLIGEKTFGKGSIQTPEELKDGSGLHITTARWVLPNGEWINGKGIAPDIEVKNKVGTDSADLQLERAIEELTK